MESQNLSIAERDYFLDGKAIPNVDQMIQWARPQWIFAYHAKNKTLSTVMRLILSCMSLVRRWSIDLTMETRAIDSEGNKIFDW